MSEYTATVLWQPAGAVFTDYRYARDHSWAFDGGLTVPAAASPHIVAPSFTTEAAVDPEVAFVASLSSCHMLWFLSIAASQGLVVEQYEDRAAGVLGRDADGRLAMVQVTLRPAVAFAGQMGLIPISEQMGLGCAGRRPTPPWRDSRRTSSGGRRPGSPWNGSQSTRCRSGSWRTRRLSNC